MNEFCFDRPVSLQSNVAVTTFSEAAAVVRSFHGARKPQMQASVLMQLERARTAHERRAAADSFREWAQIEGLLLRPQARVMRYSV
jgi:hypothetical protein